MRVVKLRRIPERLNGEVHPEAMLRALEGLQIPYRPVLLWRELESFPKAKEHLPSTAYVLLRLMDVVEALGTRNLIDAMIYWRDTIRPHFLAIPIAFCTMNEV